MYRDLLSAHTQSVSDSAPCSSSNISNVSNGYIIIPEKKSEIMQTYPLCFYYKETDLFCEKKYQFQIGTEKGWNDRWQSIACADEIHYYQNASILPYQWYYNGWIGWCNEAFINWAQGNESCKQLKTLPDHKSTYHVKTINTSADSECEYITEKKSIIQKVIEYEKTLSARFNEYLNRYALTEQEKELVRKIISYFMHTFLKTNGIHFPYPEADALQEELARKNITESNFIDCPQKTLQNIAAYLIRYAPSLVDDENTVVHDSNIFDDDTFYYERFETAEEEKDFPHDEWYNNPWIMPLLYTTLLSSAILLVHELYYEAQSI